LYADDLLPVKEASLGRNNDQVPVVFSSPKAGKIALIFFVKNEEKVS